MQVIAQVGEILAATGPMATMAVTVKAIVTNAKRVKFMRNTIKILSDSCTDRHYALRRITQSDIDWKQESRAALLVSYVATLKDLLERILSDLKSWAGGDFWARIAHRGKVESQIKQYYNDVTTGYEQFDHELKTLTLENTTETLALQRKTSAELRDMKNFMIQQSQQSQQAHELFLRLASQDNMEEVRHMERTRLTIENIDETYDMSKDVDIYPNLMENPQSVIQSLQAAEDDEEPYVRQAREALLAALRVRGNRPLYTMDSSELTVPVRVHSGGHAIIMQGIRDGEPVAVKQLNFEINNPEAALKRITRESRIWEKLNHKNIVPFVGVCAPPNSLPLMVSRWMPNDNARTYVRKLQNEWENGEDVSRADCIKLFIDIADGLCYLHSQSPQVIHGGLKASNILIDEYHNARITDFALSAIESEVQSGSRPPPMRWSAPEVLDGEENSPSADIYSFACVMLEIITDREPFHNHNHLFYLHRRIREGLRPDFPRGDTVWTRGLTSPDCKLWNLMQACWAARPDARPSAQQVRQVLGEVWDERGRKA